MIGSMPSKVRIEEKRISGSEIAVGELSNDGALFRSVVSKMCTSMVPYWEALFMCSESRQSQ